MGAGVAAQPDRPSGNSPPSAGESVVNKNLTWILGTVAVLYMIVKVFVVSHGDPNVARAVAISAGVTSLIAGIMVGGLPNLACILLLASIAWAMMDIIRMRMSSQASLVSILIFFAISILTAPRSQFGLTALVSLNLLFIVLTFRQPSTITDSRRHLAIGGVILGTVVFTFTSPPRLLPRAAMTAAVLGIFIIIGSILAGVHLIVTTREERRYWPKGQAWLG